jgi:hypothetical protein
MKRLSSYTNILSFLLILGALLSPTYSHAHSLDFWPPSTPQTQYTLNGVTFSANQGEFVAVGDVGTILNSSDGVNWNIQSSGTVNWLNGVTYGDTFESVGGFGTILTSSDGASWNTETSPNTSHLYGIAFGNNTFVAVGITGTIYTKNISLSQNWITRTSGTRYNLQAVTYSNSTFVAVGGSGTVLTSSDGTTWTNRTSTTTDYLQAVAYGNNTFVAVGASGTIVTSPDGMTWTKRTSGTTNALLGAAYGDNTFVAVGVLGTILTSPDGITWTPRVPETSARLYGVTHGNNIFVVVGEFGTVLTASGAITINSGAPYTTSETVTLTLSCQHPDGNACGSSDSMQFSNDNITWSSPEAFNTSKSWTLLSGDGTKTVYTKFEIAGNWTDEFSDSIFLDENAPVTTAFPIGGIYFDPTVYVTLTCSDASGSGCNKIYYTTDGSTPTTSSSVYSIPVGLTSATPTIKYFAVDKAGLQESVKEQSYIFDPPLFLTTTSIAPGAVGVFYSNTLTATGGFPPYTWSIISGIIPGDLSLNSSTGELSGTPTISGTFNFTAKVTDTWPLEDTAQLSITIWPAPSTRIEDTPSETFNTIQDVYNASGDGDTIQATATTFSENLNFDRNISVTLMGGFNSDYTSNTSYTTVNGTVTISSGTLTVDKILIQ